VNNFWRNKILLKPRLGLRNIITDSAPGKSTVEKWFAKFKRGEMSIEDDARSGHPKDAVTDKNIKKVHKIILNDRKVKLIEIAGTLKISKKRVEHIVHEYLDMQKLCAKWLPACS
jgi:transposase